MQARHNETTPKTRAGISVILFAAVSVLALALLVLKLVGIQIYAVVSPSMEEALSVGDLAIVAPQNCEKIETGEIIAFVNPEGKTTTHRVVSKNELEQTFLTKGDRNTEMDAAVQYADVLGVVRIVLPGIGNAAVFLSTPEGKALLGLLFAIFVVIVLLVSHKRTGNAQPS